ncbi:hypothetical protein TNCV_3246111 [Trichonephila clavipes]|nr:hypothetical protein TNCV_3246111 [Trichonephila clavipes]
MSYDYAACNKSFEYPFGLGALGKIKFLCTISHRQSSGASHKGEKWASKLLVAIRIAYIVLHSKVVQASGECTRCAKVKIPIRSPIREKNALLIILEYGSLGNQ